MRNYDYIFSNLIWGILLVTSPIWEVALTMGTIMANDSGYGSNTAITCACYSIWVAPFIQLYTLINNYHQHKNNSNKPNDLFIMWMLPLLPLLSFISFMVIFQISLNGSTTTTTTISSTTTILPCHQ